MTYYRLLIDFDNTFAWESDRTVWESIVCTKYPEHRRGGQRLSDLWIDLVKSKFVDFSYVAPARIITAKVLEVLQASRLTGYKVAPVHIAKCPPKFDKATVPKLWELVVTGSAGKAHRDSGITLLGRCNYCGLEKYSSFKNGLIVNDASYDGSDFFTVIEYPGYVLVSEQAKIVLGEAKLSNIDFIESSKVRWPRFETKPEDNAEYLNTFTS